MRGTIMIALFILVFVDVVSCQQYTNANLTFETAMCPELLNDTNFWYFSVSDTAFRHTPRCYGLHPVPSNLEKPEDLVGVCRSKHPDALPASVHSNEDFDAFVERFMWPALVGTYIPSNATFAATNLTNFDGTPVDFTPINFITIQNTSNAFSFDPLTFPKSLDPVNFKEYVATGIAKVICAMNAFPRLPNIYRLPPKPAVDISTYKCEGDGWQLAAPCGGPPSCYQNTALTVRGPSRAYFAEFNYCGEHLPNSAVSSVQCEAEYNLLKTFGPNVGIGLHVPHLAWPRYYGNWVWSDGSPFWWDRVSPNEIDNDFGNEIEVVIQPDMADIVPGVAAVAVCKKPAIPKDGPLPVPQVDTFTYTGTIGNRTVTQQCRIDPPSQWNRRCPYDRDDWAVVESENGVFCFVAIEVNMRLTPDNFNDGLCNKVHSQATLASFHTDIQLGIATHFLDYDYVVGMIYKNGTYVWSDGTPINETFWGPGQPQHKSNNAVAKLIQVLYPNSKGQPKVLRGVLQTFTMDTLPTTQKIACKLEAKPVTKCAPVIEYKPTKRLDNTYCDDSSWDKQRFCGNVYCYKALTVPLTQRTFKQVIEDDICTTMAPGSHLASIHCLEEHYYIQSYPMAHIGLYIPENTPFNVSNFQWTDGTPVDFVGWNRYGHTWTITNRQEPMLPTTPQIYGPSQKYVHNRWGDLYSVGWTAKPYPFAFGTVICKKEATQSQS